MHPLIDDLDCRWLMGGFELVSTPGSSGSEEQALGDLWFVAPFSFCTTPRNSFASNSKPPHHVCLEIRYWDLFYSKWVLVHDTAAYEPPASSTSYLSCQLSDSFVVGPRWGATTWFVCGQWRLCFSRVWFIVMHARHVVGRLMAGIRHGPPFVCSKVC